MAVPKNTTALLDALTELSVNIDRIGKIAADDLSPQWNDEMSALPEQIVEALRGKGVTGDTARGVGDTLTRYFTCIRSEIEQIQKSVQTIDRMQDSATEVICEAARTAAKVQPESLFQI